MKKNAFFLLFIMILFPFIPEDKEPLFELVSMKYPKEIVISKDWKGEELKDEEKSLGICRFDNFLNYIAYLRR